MIDNIRCLEEIKSERIIIRKYKESDATKVTLLIIEAFGSKFTNLKHIDKTVLSDLLKELKIEKELIHSENYVAEINDEVVGIIGLRQKHDYRDKGYNYIELMKLYGVRNVIVVLLSLKLMGLQEIRYNEIYIEHVAVSPKFRGRGVGSSLIKHCTNKYEKLNNALILSLNVAGNNKGSIKLYKRLGFKAVSTSHSILAMMFLGEMTWIYMEKKLK